MQNQHPSFIAASSAHNGDTEVDDWLVAFCHDGNNDNNNNLDHVVSTSHEHHQQSREMMLMLERVGTFLERADGSLVELEEHPTILSTAIVRGCHELQLLVHDLANELQQQSNEERRWLAQACLQELELQQLDASAQQQPHHQQQQRVLDESDMIRMIDAAQNLLRDVEAALALVDQQAAEELAQVALIVARLFVASLQDIYHYHAHIGGSLADEHNRKPHRGGATMDIQEILGEDKEQQQQQQQHAEESSKPQATTTKRHRSHRIRVLWPPIGPPVRNCLHWAQTEAVKRPLLSAALGIVLWPAAIGMAVVGIPVVLVDGWIQELYRNFENAPLLVGMERSAAQVYHTSRLAWISGKLVTKQALYVAQKQVERHGGLGPLTQHLTGLAVQGMVHPVATIQGTWGGLCWSADRIRDLIRTLPDQNEQKQIVAQALLV